MSQEILEQIKKAVPASKKLVLISEDLINKVLQEIATEIDKQENFLLEENKKDLERMDKSDPKHDRLMLTSERLKGIADSLIDIANMQSPIGEIMEEKTLENGINLQKVRVPMGVLGIVFEARPNVFFDCFALSFKTRNACVLKGSADAEISNTAICKLIQEVLRNNNLDENMVVFPPSSRESLAVMMKAHGIVELLIPRGGQGLINFVRENSQIPVIETGAGIVHTYLDSSGDTEKAKKIIFNAKTQRPSVCNALDCLIVHKDKLADLPAICEQMTEKNVEIYADEQSYQVLSSSYSAELLKQATENDFGTEFLGYKLSIKTVNNMEEAIEHISKYSSRHTEAIIAEDLEKTEEFLKRIDATTVFANASTRFTDGGVFGLGAEIGISTQKLHARGPMGLKEITTYKWLGRGSGQTRE